MVGITCSLAHAPASQTRLVTAMDQPCEGASATGGTGNSLAVSTAVSIGVRPVVRQLSLQPRRGPRWCCNITPKHITTSHCTVGALHTPAATCIRSQDASCNHRHHHHAPFRIVAVFRLDPLLFVSCRCLLYPRVQKHSPRLT